MAMTLSKVLWGVLESYVDLTNEASEWRMKTADCLDRIEAGETIIDGKRSEIALIWCAVNFISKIDTDEFEDGGKWARITEELERNMNLLYMLIQRMGTFTYRELLDLFPVRIHYEDCDKYYGSNGVIDSTDQSLGNIGILILCGCGIHFNDATEGTTDFDTKIGDGIMEFITGNYNPVIRGFYSKFLYVTYGILDSYDEQESY